ncbi:MAG: chromate transporter [Andreesenia angusta]|nr:chromate transporter [Andreesenia angusta]
MKIFLNLFISFFKIGMFSFGGGFAMIPFIQKEVIYANHWVNYNEFLDMIAISQITPGPIAINSATFIGTRVAGPIGGAICTIAVILPSFIVVLSMIMILKKLGKTKLVDTIYSGLRPVVMALILSALVSVGKASIFDLKSIIVAIIAFIIFSRKKMNIMLGMGIAGLIGYLLF